MRLDTQGAGEMKLGLHVIQFPSGRFGFVGSLPLDMATMVPANTSAVMGGRAIRNERGELVEPKWPTFDTSSAAVDFAAKHNHKAIA